MTPAYTDVELIRSCSGMASPLVRVLVARIADRGREAAAVRDLLATIHDLIESGKLREALALIDQCRDALDWRWTAPHYPASTEHQKD